MKKITLTLVAVVAGLLLVSQAFAWGPVEEKASGPAGEQPWKN